MRHTFRAALFTAGVAVMACAYNPPPIPVVAAPHDLDRLVGVWNGEYQTTRVERAGTISFTLAAGSDSAYGDVTMIPRMNDSRNQFDTRLGTPAQLPRPLRITFVRMQGGDVSGALDPYVDPDLGCMVETRFRGALRDARTLQGTFVTRDETGAIVQRGTWKVTKAAAG